MRCTVPPGGPQGLPLGGPGILQVVIPTQRTLRSPGRRHNLQINKPVSVTQCRHYRSAHELLLISLHCIETEYYSIELKAIHLDLHLVLVQSFNTLNVSTVEPIERVWLDRCIYTCINICCICMIQFLDVDLYPLTTLTHCVRWQQTVKHRHKLLYLNQICPDSRHWPSRPLEGLWLYSTTIYRSYSH